MQIDLPSYIEALARRNHRTAVRILAHCVRRVLRRAKEGQVRFIARRAALRAEQWSVRPSKARTAATKEAGYRAIELATISQHSSTDDYSVLLAAFWVATSVEPGEPNVAYLVRAATNVQRVDPTIMATIKRWFGPSGRRRPRPRKGDTYA